VSALPTSSPAPTVVLVCGERLRGDDAVAFDAVAALPAGTRAAATIVEAGALDVAALVGLPEDANVVVVDAVAGVAAGELVAIPLADLARSSPRDAPGAPAARSTHALPIPATLAIAAALRGRAVEGTFLGVGIAQCVPGAPLSPRVAAAVPALAQALAQRIGTPVEATARPC